MPIFEKTISGIIQIMLLIVSLKLLIVWRENIGAQLMSVRG